jgi:hypothetical protein
MQRLRTAGRDRDKLLARVIFHERPERLRDKAQRDVQRSADKERRCVEHLLLSVNERLTGAEM